MHLPDGDSRRCIGLDYTEAVVGEKDVPTDHQGLGKTAGGVKDTLQSLR